MISKEIVQCTEDMKAVAQTGRMTLDIQVRAYDLLEKIMDLPDGGTVGPADMYCDTVATWCSTLGPAEDLCRTFHEHAALLDAAFDAGALKKEAQDRLTPFSVAFEKAVIKAKEAAERQRAIADKAYQKELGLSTDQFIQLRAWEIIEKKEGANIDVLVGSGGTASMWNVRR